MKRILIALMFFPFSAMTMEKKEGHVEEQTSIAMSVNLHAINIVIDRENLAFMNFGRNVDLNDSLDLCGKCETYCALTMRLSRANGAYKHKANIYHLNKKVGTEFPMTNPSDMDMYYYTVMCSLLKLENNVADIEYSVTLEKSTQRTNKMTIPMNGRDSANLKFDNDVCPVTLEIAVTRQNE
jgi:hypothetical protein